MLPDCRDLCAGYPWVREVWLLASADASGRPVGDADVLVVCDRLYRFVAPGRRRPARGRAGC